MTSKAQRKVKKTELAEGTSLEILRMSKKWAKVDASGIHGYVRSRTLQKSCKPHEPLRSEPMARTDPGADGGSEAEDGSAEPSSSGGDNGSATAPPSGDADNEKITAAVMELKAPENIPAETASSLAGVLVPSDDFKEAQRARAERTKALFWTSLAVGTTGFATAGALYAVRSGQAADLRADIRTYAEAGGNAAEQARLIERRKDMGQLDTLTVVFAGVGLAAVGVGVFLLLTGEDPNRHDVETSVSAGENAGGLEWLSGLSLTPGGLTFTGEF